MATPQRRREEACDMPETTTDPPAFRLISRSGLRAGINANGSLRHFDCDPIALALFVGNEVEGGPANLYLRHHAHTLQWLPLLGPASRSRFRVDAATGALIGSGTWLGINYSVALVLAADAAAWFWHVRLENSTPDAQQLDLTYAQDIALAPYGAIRLNEYYVSQYIDHTPLHHPARGYVVASRQNAAADGRNPWCLVGSLRAGESYATDSLQFHGLASRRGDAPVGLAAQLPGRRLQHEHAMVVIRDLPLRLAPGERAAAGFFGFYMAHHLDATSPVDLARVNQTLSLPEAAPIAIDEAATSIDAQPGATDAIPSASADPATLFSVAAPLNGRDLSADELGALFAVPWRHEEIDQRGERLSFFCDEDRHVVLGAKERRVLRPHGHLLRTGRHLTPDESALTSTVWMSGVFHSLLTQGHVSINRFLSTVRSYLGLFRSNGQRVFVELDDGWRLLNVPSAFEMSPDACRWIYSIGDTVIEVRCEARSDPQELTLSIRVVTGAALRFLISHQVALNGDDGSEPGAARWWRQGEDILVAPLAGSEIGRRFPDGSFQLTPDAGTHFERVGGDELLFIDGHTRREPYLCVVTARSRSVGLRIRGQLIAAGSQSPLRVADDQRLIPSVAMTVAAEAGGAGPLARMAEILPWYTHNALVHYLSPRGLEQYSGGGWGTRDVCQGPVEMLLALGHLPPIRDILLRVIATQNADGDWPQWFMFFERERDIRAGDSHGDIVFWPLLVLAQYLIASGDAGVLDERLPFFDARGPQAGETATLWQHVERALALIERRVIAGTVLPAYGHGDWNDSLQPVDPALRDHMCSAWIATLQVQTLSTLARALRAIGRGQDATRLHGWAAAVQRDFQRLLLVDGVLAGYAIFEPAAVVRYLLHPQDRTTGVSYSVLAMIHAILEDMLTPAQAGEHLRLIGRHLSGPDGVRLFDRPMAYHGGPQRLFQRAESATFFGREIGLMYTHAHLRYAQALAHVGDAPGFFHALCQANPIAIGAIVPSATPRQANCYYSSSDAAFDDRYQASDEYQRVAQGSVALDGGWRVYSSGAGIALGLIMRSFLGMSCQSQFLRVDPVIPAALDGLKVHTVLLGREFELIYRIGAAGCGVNQLALNDRPLPFERDSNPHRSGAALVAIAALGEHLAAGRNVLAIDIG
jgi:1,2-beta-oligoglucan phosphorylase